VAAAASARSCRIAWVAWANPWAIDVLLAALVAVHMFAGLRHPVPAVAAAVLFVAVACLIWRRRAPLAVLVLVGSVYLAYEAVGYANVRALPFALLVVLYTVAVRRPLAVSVTAGVVLGLGVAVAAVVQPGALDEDDFVDQLVALAAAWTLGTGVRLNRIRTSLLEEKAVQLVRAHAVDTRMAVERERARIARELHDIVAHHVSVIVAQAGATRRVFDTQPEQARSALQSIETIGREAMTEMRRLLTVLRGDERGEDHVAAPGLGEMPALVAQMEQVQVPVDLAVRGTTRQLPPGVELNAYRIVQESLTNTLKHAGPTRARVVVHYGPDTLVLRISDEGRSGTAETTAKASVSATGNGLAGMRQRAALLGGRLTAGPGPQGGFRVTAVLPVEAAQ
jgi:signal transduction histidine kinase